MFCQTRLSAARFGLVALVLTVSAAVMGPLVSAADDAKAAKLAAEAAKRAADARAAKLAAEAREAAKPPTQPNFSPDNKLAVLIGNNELTVGKVTTEKVRVKTDQGEMDKSVEVIKKLYSRGGEKEKYLAAKFVPVKSDKSPLIAVSEKTISAMVGTSGDQLWTVRHDAKGDKAEITFKGEEIKVTLGEKVMRFDFKTGRQLKD